VKGYRRQVGANTAFYRAKEGRRYGIR